MLRAVVEFTRADQVRSRAQHHPSRTRTKFGPQGKIRASARSLCRDRRVVLVKDLKALSQSIVDATSALPADASVDQRIACVEQVVGDYLAAQVKSISGVGDYADFLRDCGFAKAAVKKLAPAFKSISGEHDRPSEAKQEALDGLLAEVRSIASIMKPRTENIR